MTAEEFLHHLGGVRSRGPGKWSAQCPAHTDKSPSLSIREVGDRILLHCFSGCKPEEIVAALGLEMRDLFTDSPLPRGQRPAPKPQKIDLAQAAFHLEMAALDWRLRADSVLQGVDDFNGEGLSDDDRDRLLDAVSFAFESRTHAELLEQAADEFRLLAFEEKKGECHAAQC